MPTLEQTVHDFVRRNFDHTFGQPAVAAQPDAEWVKLRATGSRLWLDTGDLDEAGKLWNTSFDALTTNNTLLNKEIQKGIYDQLMAEAAGILGNLDPQTKVLEIAFILNASHALRLVHRFDANVSVELHTDLAHDIARTVTYGKRYLAICPERFIVKVPLTPAGYLGARQLVQAGIPINFTLGFSARQNYLAALLTNPKYCNVFMGRLNSYVADNKLGTGENVGEKATLATQRELLQLRKAGKSQTNLIGASVRTGTQVGALAGIDVFTIPTKAAAEYRAKPLAAPTSRVNDDPGIPLNAGITLKQFAGDTLWDVPAKFKDAAAAIVEQASRPFDSVSINGRDARSNSDQLTPVALQDHFTHAGFPGFLPKWNKADIDTITKDGKIPIHAKWASHLESGELGLDALMNIAALQSFVTDQTALDNRIRSVLKL
ncbi:MAG: Transaldolase [Verrucomicrobiae bacterium]|nr:Transaldolase [Verrucomicrobiae bacterium]